jgi:hypothetical protein
MKVVINKEVLEAKSSVAVGTRHKSVVVTHIQLAQIGQMIESILGGVLECTLRFPSVDIPTPHPRELNAFDEVLFRCRELIVNKAVQLDDIVSSRHFYAELLIEPIQGDSVIDLLRIALPLPEEVVVLWLNEPSAARRDVLDFEAVGEPQVAHERLDLVDLGPWSPTV